MVGGDRSAVGRDFALGHVRTNGKGLPETRWEDGSTDGVGVGLMKRMAGRSMTGLRGVLRHGICCDVSLWVQKLQCASARGRPEYGTNRDDTVSKSLTRQTGRGL